MKTRFDLATVLAVCIVLSLFSACVMAKARSPCAAASLADWISCWAVFFRFGVDGAERASRKRMREIQELCARRASRSHAIPERECGVGRSRRPASTPRPDRPGSCGRSLRARRRRCAPPSNADRGRAPCFDASSVRVTSTCIRANSAWAVDRCRAHKLKTSQWVGCTSHCPCGQTHRTES